MTETVVHVTTLDQWKSVLDVWFEKGYEWKEYSDTDYHAYNFDIGNKILVLNRYISYFSEYKFAIEYSEFMAQQKEDKEVKTYYVTKEQLELIENLGEYDIPFFHLANGSDEKIKNLAQEIPDKLDKPILRYLGGDETIEFKVKEPLYRLWATNENGETVYFYSWQKHVSNPESAFTAPLEEIKKWQTPAWKIEKVDD